MIVKTVQSQTKTGGRNAKPIVGLGRAAKALGVNPDHLRWVLQGKRVSKILSEQYAAFKAATEKQKDNSMYTAEFKTKLLKGLASAQKDLDSLHALCEITAARMKETNKHARTLVASIAEARALAADFGGAESAARPVAGGFGPPMPDQSPTAK